VFLEAAPRGFDPGRLGRELAALDGVAEVHDLHVWQLGPTELAMSAHVLVTPPNDCHDVAARMRGVLAADHGIGHVTLQVDHADTAAHRAEDCVDAHGEIHIARP
jgi:cobalt-zinc-cadmium efflux system protein